MSNQKESEVRLVREALTHLGLSARSVCPCDPPFPDVFVTLLDGSLIGVEVTDYYGDAAGGGGSPNRAFASNWLRVEAEIRRQVERHPGLPGGHVTLRERRALPSVRDADALGRELVDFAAEVVKQGCGPGPSGHELPFPPRYRLMNEYVAELTLRPTGADQLSSWGCRGFGGGFRLDVDRLMASIRKKEQKAYDWGCAEERWLLIAAGAAPVTIASWVGPEWQQAGKLESLALPPVTAFDRVLFLESGFAWAVEIWRAAGLPVLPSQSKCKTGR